MPDEASFGDFAVSAWLLADTKLRLIDHVVRDERGKLHTFTETEIVDADERLFRDRRPALSKSLVRQQG
jgi:hypothetical protein